MRIRRWLAVAPAVVALILVSACGTRDVGVGRADLEAGAWPFKEDQAKLHCYKSGAITADADGQTYVVHWEWGDNSIPAAKLPQLQEHWTDPATGLIALPFTNLAEDRCKAN